MNVLDLFCGAGGFSYGFLKAGFSHLFGVDNCIDTPSIKETYEYNIGQLKKIDIAKFDGKAWKDKIDVIIGSPPCKSFSVANTKTRNLDTTLIREFMRIVREINPKVWIWENVNGVRAKLSKQTRLVENDFLSEGVWESFNMSEYGMLQMRKRTFVSSLPLKIKKVQHNFLDGNRSWGIYMHDRGNILRPIYTLTAHGSRRGGNFGLKVFVRGVGLRDLTLEEQAWLQTFPFDYTFFGAHTAIETQIGNAVPPFFAYKIAQYVKQQLLNEMVDLN